MHDIGGTSGVLLFHRGFNNAANKALRVLPEGYEMVV
jgi:hypothetical protein